MEDSHLLPEVIEQVQRALKPYIRQRQEVAHIRRVLSAHLGYFATSQGDQRVSHPLSLAQVTDVPETGPSGVRGLRKDYFRCIRANVKAQKEFAQISKQHQLSLADQTTKGASQVEAKGSGTPVDSFIGLVQQRRKYERLRILQDYLDMLAKKPAAATNHFDPKADLKSVQPLPQLPAEFLSTASRQQPSARVDLKDVADELERAVLRAKLLLKREQKLLIKVQAAAEPESGPSRPVHGRRVKALAVTRNELIAWIETELSKAGESPPKETDHQVNSGPGSSGNEPIDVQLGLIQRQYIQYAKARRDLIHAASSGLDPPAISLDQNTTASADTEQSGSKQVPSHSIYPHLQDLVSISNEQKFTIQQKSHVTISLAKQLKDACQGMDRLADESHLLPAHPLPTAPPGRNALQASTAFGEDMSAHYEKPNSSSRAGAWVHAAKAASKSHRSRHFKEH